jgi:hypothetical protein
MTIILEKKDGLWPVFFAVKSPWQLSLSLFLRLFLRCHLVEADGDNKEKACFSETQIAQRKETKVDKPKDFVEDRHDDSNYRYNQK